MSDAREIAAKLTEAERKVLSSPRIDHRAWEPRDPFHPVLNHLVEGGLATRVDGRCGFEMLKDAMVKLTPLGVEVRSILQGEQS